MNIISFSGGKDSTALILWAKENLQDFEVVFCDTKWEHELTYKYINYINYTLLGNTLIIITSEKYDGFIDLTIKKKRVASTMARFCTEELKLKPMQKYIQDKENVNLYLGIRRDESHARSKLSSSVYDNDYYKCWIHRPLIDWTAQDCFDIMKKHNVEPNPLYKLGMKRVGCMPCIMTSHKEMKNIFEQFPDVETKLNKLEQYGHGFFPPDYIPKRYCSKTAINKKGETVKYPGIEDVKKYLLKNENQLKLTEFDGDSCMSYYSICE